MSTTGRVESGYDCETAADGLKELARFEEGGWDLAGRPATAGGVNRLADAFGFFVPGPQVFEVGAKFLLARGYR